MYMKLPATYSDPKTGVPLPDAILVILDASFHLRATSAILQTRVYMSAAAYLAARDPVSEEPLPLNSTEIAAQMPALLHACYTVLANRPQFTGSSVITP